MLIACVGVLALVLLLPRLGVEVAGAGVLLTLLMIGCCVLPMLLLVLPRGEDKDGGCCGGNKPTPSRPRQGGEKDDKKTPGCH